MCKNKHLPISVDDPVWFKIRINTDAISSIFEECIAESLAPVIYENIKFSAL